MESGVCFIKEEYLDTTEHIAKDSPATEENSKRKLVESESDSNATENARHDNKYQKTNKRERKRGQNKNRPVYKEDRLLHLCHSLVNGPNRDNVCSFSNCRYEHNLEKYLKSKGLDFDGICPVFEVKGFCPRGVTCRWAKSHLDVNGCNIRAEYYNAAAKAETCNGITPELQVRLRKRDYDFSRTKALVSHFDKLRDERKEKEKIKRSTDVGVLQGLNAIENEKLKDKLSESTIKADRVNENFLKENLPEKAFGSAVDDESAGRDCRSIKSVEFRNKIILSPLTTVGNLPFRRICKEYGADITCGEMACCVPLVKGFNQEWALTKRHASEDVFGVQLCGNNPTIIGQAAQLMQENVEVDFIDLNIGCPIDLIYQQGGGSALMRRTNILETTVRTCSTLCSDIPFTVKMRTGIHGDKNVAHELLPQVEEWGAAAVTLHGRSREQRYTKMADWNYIEECAAKAKTMPVIGNGDILSFTDYNECKSKSPHVSSVMIGRGALIKPWIFREIKEQANLDFSSTERYSMLQRYVNYGLEHWGSDTKGVETTRRFLLEWLSFLYRHIPYDLLLAPPQKINQRPPQFRGRDEMETLMSSPKSADWVKISELLLGPIPNGFTFVPKHKANAY